MAFDFLKFAFSAGELSPDLHGRGDLENFEFGFREGENVYVDWRGSIKSRPGTELCDRVLDQESDIKLHSFAFNTEPEDNYLLIFSHKKLRFMQDGMYITSDIGARIGPAASRLDSIFALSDWIMFFDGFLQYKYTLVYDNEDEQHSASYPYCGSSRVNLNGDVGVKVYEIDTPYKSEDLAELRISQYRDEMILTHPKYQVRKLVRLGHNNWEFEVLDFLRDRTASPRIIDAVIGKRDTTTGGDHEGYVALAVSAVFQGNSDQKQDGLEGRISERVLSGKINISTHFIILNWAQVDGAVAYRVYGTEFVPSNSGIKTRELGLLEEVNGTNFVYDFISPNRDIIPIKVENPFRSAFPRTSALYNQRRLYASTAQKPSAIFASSLKHHDDFSFGPREDQAFEFLIDSKEVNAVNDIIATYRGVFLFSQKAIWLLRGAEDAGISPTNAVNENEQESGAYPNPAPIKVLESILYVSGLDDTVRALRPTSTPNFFDTQDIGIYSVHLFEHGIISWAYSGRKDRVLWAVREDGKLLSCTYAPEHSVHAWCKHSTRGRFLDVATVTEKEVDRVYFVVERNGNKYIERFALDTGIFLEQNCPVDAAVRYRGRNLGGAVRIGTRISKAGVYPLRPVGATSHFSSGFSSGLLKTFSADPTLKLYNKANKQALSKIFTGTDVLAITPKGKYSIDASANSAGFFPVTVIVEDEANLEEEHTLREFEANEVQVARAGTMYNLCHLDGYSVRAFEFDATVEGRVSVSDFVQSGTTRAHPAGETTVGIPFTSYIKTLPLIDQERVVEDKPKKSYSVSVRVERSSAVSVGIDDELYPTAFDTSGESEVSFRSGLHEVSVGDNWDRDSSFTISSDYPFRVLGLVINYDYGDQPQQEQ